MQILLSDQMLNADEDDTNRSNRQIDGLQRRRLEEYWFQRRRIDDKQR